MGSIAEEAMQGSAGSEERILVSVRVRPLNEKELSRNDLSEWECINGTTIIYRSNLSATERSLYPTAYTFDRVFSVDSDTRQVYEEAAKEVALSVLGGINSSIFAYGQTSSGKTYTMSGITEYAVADIFNYIEKHTERDFVLRFSALEIYNESVRDLLSVDSTPLRLLDDPEKGTVVERLTEETVRNWNHFQELIFFCEAQRQIGETALNEVSSRSHQILRLTVESSASEFMGNGSSLAASVNFVDLAGSERASQTNSAGTRLKEGCHINRSLLTLGTVIRKLSKGRNGHIPFRDSKLTRILQSSLAGNAKTAIICTMSPARSHVEQTRNTLLFASCAKEVTTNAKVNVVMSDKLLVKQLQKELARLESELKNLRPTKPDTSALLKEKDLLIEMLKREVMDLRMQRDLAQSQIKDMIQVVGDDRSSSELDSLGHQYPKLRVRNSFDFENRTVELPNSLSFDCIESIRSFDASQYSDGHSISSDENYFQLPDLEKSLPVRISSPALSVESFDDARNDLDQKSVEEQHEDNLEERCREVRRNGSEDIITNTHKHSNSADISKILYTESVASSPTVSGLTEVDNRDKENPDLWSAGLKDNKEINSLEERFVLPSPQKISRSLTQSGASSSKTVKLTRSRSCKATLMRDTSSDWFDQEEMIQNTTPIGIEKDFTGTPEGPQKKTSTLNYNAKAERLSSDAHENSLESTVDIQNTKTYIDNGSCDDNSLPPGEKEKDDLESSNLQANPEVPATDLQSDNAIKKFKDVGLDPLQSEEEKQMEWSSEFKRLQKEIIGLWHACHVSLVHRTYFFLLFKGDPSDSIYMEVELRRLFYLKQTFAKGNQTVEDGYILNAETSHRYLRTERQMLSKQMEKKLSKSERENLYIKWGISLSSKHRRLQLSHRLWSRTDDIDHIRESATIVAKLVGSVEPEQAFKEMFGLNFAPRSTKRKSFGWTVSMKNIL
ncbi:kinesin-like protein KIN-7H [Vigna radiata var. radiata]|uniref:Kinesin-like protein n=1 Tax=Vigna radiata var. radiata TaxID=3916 RepID=A0A1S3UTG9_VIGRR|nr:kinesin-like protein KIN-7H [Vigna radiata var. radiata]XP_014509315.1 kinesin-like protein KIN-7H [Vigna radiata var. radiata]XP_022638471.1 kinesin-like protein KIN-7H [Vigna radiata var. radiata]